MGCIAFALYGVIPGFMAIAMRMELLFVNDLSLPFNSGLIAAWIVVMSLLVAGALWLGSSRFARRPGVRQPRLVLWSLAFFFTRIFVICSDYHKGRSQSPGQYGASV